LESNDVDYQVSARKYRPGIFDEVVGQPHVVQTLVNAIASKRIAHAFLFSGTRGVGKTTVARILAKCLNCEQGPTATPCNACANCLEITQGTSVDVIEIDGASNTSVDDVREIRENVKFTPFRGQYRVYIIDEVHMLSNSAFNALLKTLEEPPAHVVFIFATTEIHKIPATILSRCQHYNFRRISKPEIVARLRHVAERDKLNVEDRSLSALARASEGSMRDALSLMDQAVAFGGSSIRHSDLEALLGAVPQELVRAMATAVLDQQSAPALRAIAEVLDQGHDVRTYCGEIVEYIRNLLIAAVVPSAAEVKGLIEGSDEDIRQLKADAQRMTPDQLQEALRIFTQAEDALRASTHPRFVLEAAAVRATRLEARAAAATASAAPKRRPDEVGRTGPDQEMLNKPVPGKAGTSPGLPTGTPAPPDMRNGSSSSSVRLPVDTPGSVAPPPEAAAFKGQGPGAGDQDRMAGDLSRSTAQDAGRPSDPVPDSAGVAAPAVLDWNRFQEAVSSEYPNIAPFLEMGRLVGCEGDQVLIGFAKQGTVGRAMLEKPDNIHALVWLGERLVGRPLRFRIIELTETDGPGPTMGELRAAKQAEERMILFQQARAHPVVRQALELFGGELSEVRPRSLSQEVQE
jgi:DNA polymerase-3 subunit gamma/tau